MRGPEAKKIVILLAVFSAAAVLDAAPPAAQAPDPGLAPASRAVVVEDARATRAFKPDPERVRRMLTAGLTNLARAGSVRAAWAKFLKPDDVVGVKVLSAPGPMAGTRPAVAEALVRSLIEAGFRPGNIILWDRRRRDLERAGFGRIAERYGVALAGSVEAGFDPDHFYDNPIPGRLVWGDLDFQPGKETMGRRSHVTRLLTRRITRLISLAPLLNHNVAGVSGCLYNLASGSVDNVLRFLDNGERMAVALPEIYAMPEISDKATLHIVDALIAQYYGEGDSLLHYSATLNQLWFSSDPVALDVLGVRELEALRRRFGAAPLPGLPQLYRNAAILQLGEDRPEKILVEKMRLE
ncbi:MAG: DUF362 domain-containing protein [Verrucomicrobia bacterium]|nr:DUF362 domain-containing protein [Verrucomicrobiota bacterium]